MGMTLMYKIDGNLLMFLQLQKSDIDRMCSCFNGGTKCDDRSLVLSCFLPVSVTEVRGIIQVVALILSI